MTAPPIPQVTLEQYEQAYRGLHPIHAAVDCWAGRRPDDLAIVNATRGTSLTWRQLQRGSMALANELWHRGFRAGDYLDVPRLQQLARDEVAKLRERGRWDG
jgi:hypothetical protein